MQHYARTVVAYHGCDATFARRLLAGKADFKVSTNQYDWLGRGVYFWEYGADRAYEFAKIQKRRGKVAEPAVVGALVQLAECFDLMDTRFTRDLAAAFVPFKSAMESKGWALPENLGSTPDKNKRYRDCAVLNWYLDLTEENGATYKTVRCGFVEGNPIYEGAGIRQQSHIQLAVRDPGCILGVFRPTV